MNLTDLLTAAKDIVTGINSLAQNYLNVQGAATLTNITTLKQARGGAGRLCTVSVTTAGSAAGVIYDSPNSSTTSNPVYTIPMTVGVYVVNLPMNFGILVAPGTGQAVTVSFS